MVCPSLETCIKEKRNPHILGLKTIQHAIKFNSDHLSYKKIILGSFYPKK